MKKKKSKLLYLLLVAALIVSMFPISVLADDVEDDDNNMAEDTVEIEEMPDEAGTIENTADDNAISDGIYARPLSKETNNIRPVWIVAHKCNTNVWSATNRRIDPSKSEVQKAINGGCNGVEVDIRWSPYKNNLVLCHQKDITRKYCDTVEEFLNLDAWNNSDQMCLVIYDIKEPQYMKQLMDITHQMMDKENSKINGINFIYSVGTIKDASGFSNIIDELRPNEGICIDMDWEAGADTVERFFRNYNFERCWYGNGIDHTGGFFKYKTSRKVQSNCIRAMEIKNGNVPMFASDTRIKKVETWTVNTEKKFLKVMNSWNLDSLMVSDHIRDGRIKVKKDNSKITRVSYLLKQSPNTRLATRDDNPFQK